MNKKLGLKSGPSGLAHTNPATQRAPWPGRTCGRKGSSRLEHALPEAVGRPQEGEQAQAVVNFVLCAHCLLEPGITT